MSDLSMTADSLRAYANWLDGMADDTELDLDTDLAAWASLNVTAQVLASVRERLAERLAVLMAEKRVTVEGVGTFERHRRTERRQWDNDSLLRYVLDSRKVDADGVVADESPVEKVLACWSLGGPRLTALRDRGIDPSEFCETEHRGWAIQLHATESTA